MTSEGQDVDLGYGEVIVIRILGIEITINIIKKRGNDGISSA